jgi:hypothetical protein
MVKIVSNMSPKLGSTVSSPTCGDLNVVKTNAFSPGVVVLDAELNTFTRMLYSVSNCKALALMVRTVFPADWDTRLASYFDSGVSLN